MKKRGKRKKKIFKLWAVAHDHRPDLGDGPDPFGYWCYASKKRAKSEAKSNGAEMLGPFVLAVLR